MNTIVLITFNVEGLPIPFKLASKNEPNKLQIIEKLNDIVKEFELKGSIEQKNFVQEKGNKMYVFSIGEKKVLITVERLDVYEFLK